MPCDMTYTYNGIKGIPTTTDVKVYQFGQVDGSGSMALCWLSNEISGSQYEVISRDPITMQPIYGWKTYTLSGWITIHNRCLTPK